MKSMRLSPALAVSFVVFALTLSPDARSQCVSATGCLCMGATAVLDLTVVSVDGPRTTLSVTGVHTAGDAGTFVSELTMAREPGDAQGTPWLGIVVGGDVVSRIPEDASGNVACDWTSPPFVLPATQASQIALSPSCDSDLVALGLKQPPCNDVGGCRCGDGGQQGWLLVGVAAALFLLSSRRARTVARAERR